MRYEHTVCPDRWRVFGRVLNTHTLGQQLLLERVASPFLDADASGGCAPTLGDTLLAFQICRRSFRSGCRFLASRTAGLRLRLLGWLWFCRDWTIHGRRLAACIQAAWEVPNHWQSAEAVGRLRGTPTILGLQTTLTQNGWTWEQTYDCPLQIALWIHFAAAEGAGRLQLVNEKEQAAMDVIKAQLQAQHA